MKRKICVIISARASYARIKSILTAIKKNRNLELQIVTTCSANSEEFGNVAGIIEEDGFTITEKIFSHIKGETLATSVKTTGLTLIKLSSVLEKLKPDIVITNGDRYETIANAIAAAYLNIPLAHIQGGDVTGNIDEKVRHAITKMADIHFATSITSYRRLLLLGENPDKVFMFGCPSIDLIKDIYGSLQLDFNPLRKYKSFGNITEMPDEYYVIMQHPTTTDIANTKKNFEKTLKVIPLVNKPFFILLPNADASTKDILQSIKQFCNRYKELKVQCFFNMNPLDFIKFLYHSKCLIGNSSVGIRECSYLGIPVVNIGNRQFERERGTNVIDVDYNTKDIFEAIKVWKKRGRPSQSFIYGTGTAGKKIADTLANIDLSYEKRLTYKIK